MTKLDFCCDELQAYRIQSRPLECLIFLVTHQIKKSFAERSV